MKSLKLADHSLDLMQRLDDVRMNARDREHAKVMIRQAEAFAELVAHIHERVCDILVTLTSTFVSFRARLRSISSEATVRGLEEMRELMHDDRCREQAPRV